MTEAVRTMFRLQANGCESLGSLLTARLLRLLADAMQLGHPVEDRVLGWKGDLSRYGDAMALRLAGGLHALVMTGQDADLSALYQNAALFDDAQASAILLKTLRNHSAHLLHWLNHPPQTNEIRRSAALILAGHWLTARFGLPLQLSELGASAGLNLLWDHYRLNIGAGYGPADAAIQLQPDWQGDLPSVAPPHIADRAGVDLQPLHPVHDRLRMLSYIWADQSDRLERSRAALDMAARIAPSIAQADAGDWLETRLANAAPACLHLVYHTIAWQYFPAATKQKCEAALQDAGARTTPASPLARLAMEADGSDDGAPLTLELWTGGPCESIALGRIDFHGRWLRWGATAQA